MSFGNRVSDRLHQTTTLNIIRPLYKKDSLIIRIMQINLFQAVPYNFEYVIQHLMLTL